MGAGPEGDFDGKTIKLEELCDLPLVRLTSSVSESQLAVYYVS